MERHVKERLIGAAVLVAAAVILIPEMLSGPKRPATASAPARAGEAPMKTYTIDLNHSPGAAPSAAPPVAEQVPPSEEVPPSEASETSSAAPSGSSSESASTAAASPAVVPPAQAPTAKSPQVANRNDTAVKTAPAASQTIPESAPIKPSPESARAAVKEPPVKEPAREAAKESTRPATVVQNTPKPLAPAATAPITRQWAVQLGSFASKSGAERLAQEWEGRGQKALIMPLVKANGTTLYRVRLGPFAERQAADDALRKVGNRVAGAAVVAHP